MGRKRNPSSFRDLQLILAIYLVLFGFCTPALSDQNLIRRKKSLRLPLSSAIFPVSGNVYPDGLFFVKLNIGNPPQLYFLDIDTGSDLTWLQCDAPCIHCFKGPHPLYKPQKKLVHCEDPLCGSIHTISRIPCDSPHDQCDYEIAYADHGSSSGVLVRDIFQIPLDNGSLLQTSLAFGCGYDQQVSSANSPAPTDGVLGLGHGKSSIISQLQELGLTRNVFGHCFSQQGGGYLFLGDDFVQYSRVTWMPLSLDPSKNHYSLGPASFFLGNQQIGRKGVAVVMDSGSSYTYFAGSVYEAFVKGVKKNLPAKQLKEVPEDETLPLCWKGKKKFKYVSDVKNFFKTLTLAFGKHNKVHFEIPPEGYLIISSTGNVCLGILSGSEIGLGDQHIVGDISMQDLMVINDNEKHQIGWIRMDCNRLPKSGTAPS